MHRLIIIASLMSLFSAAAAEAQPRGTSVSLLVSTDWLAERLRDPDVVTVWTGQGSRDEPLIAGARPLTHDSLMTMAAGGHDLAATDDLVAAVEATGVSNHSHVVVYGEPLAAGWLFFALEYLGHDRVSMLDGGLAKWRAEGRPVVATPAPVTRGSFKPTPRPWLRATAGDVQAQKERGTVLLDARSAKEFDAGRIPGARLLPWQDVYDDAKLQILRAEPSWCGSSAQRARPPRTRRSRIVRSACARACCILPRGTPAWTSATTWVRGATGARAGCPPSGRLRGVCGSAISFVPDSRHGGGRRR